MLAIVIPYYKINYFEETLKALSMQTDNRFHVYIGDDNSSDDPSILLQHYSDTFSYTYQKFSTNLGGVSLVQQWNRCLQLLKDESWVMLLGDDDVVSDNLVASFYQYLDEFQDATSVVRFATYKIDANSRIYSDLFVHPIFEKSIEILLQHKRSSLSEYVFKRSSLETIGIKELPLAWYSDLLAVLEFSNYGLLFSISSAHVKIRLSENSISGKKDNFYMKDEATFRFYHYVLSHSGSKLSRLAQQFIERKLNTVYLNDKKRFHRLAQILFLYIKKRRWEAIIKLFQSIIIKNQK